jgi:hypothetical protein
MPTLQFRTPKGRLTAHSFSCGYRERRTEMVMAKRDWIPRFATMVPSITSVSTIADPKQLRFELSGSNIELSPKPATCSTANLVG